MKKKAKKHVKTLRDWGYEVIRSDGFAVEDGEEIHTLYVEGAGVKLYLRDDDLDSLENLADLDGHIQRCTQLLEAEMLAEEEAA